MVNYNFVEIGCSDFDTLIQYSHDGEIGLSVEPIKCYLDALPNKPNTKKVQYAISDKNGSIIIFYVKPEDIKTYNLPWWLKGCNSVSAPHPQVVEKLLEQNLPLSIIQQEEVRVITYAMLAQIYEIETVDNLKIDTEGHDSVILESLIECCSAGLSAFPNKILFESNLYVATAETIDKIEFKLHACGYSTTYRDFDTEMVYIKNSKPVIVFDSRYEGKIAKLGDDAQIVYSTEQYPIKALQDTTYKYISTTYIYVGLMENGQFYEIETIKNFIPSVCKINMIEYGNLSLFGGSRYYINRLYDEYRIFNGFNSFSSIFLNKPQLFCASIVMKTDVDFVNAALENARVKGDNKAGADLAYKALNYYLNNVPGVVLPPTPHSLCRFLYNAFICMFYVNRSDAILLGELVILLYNNKDEEYSRIIDTYSNFSKNLSYVGHVLEKNKIIDYTADNKWYKALIYFDV